MDAKELILHKSFQLFRRYGIRSITMDEIATQCGVSKKTLYQHFEDKDSLVMTIMDAMIAKSETQCMADSRQCENAIHELFLSIDMLRQMFDGINPAMLFDLHKYHAKANARLEDHKRSFLSALTRSNLERGIAEGLYRPELNITIITHMHLQNIGMVFESSDQLGNHSISVYQWQTEIMLHYMYGIATAKGVKLIEKYKQQRAKLTA